MQSWKTEGEIKVRQIMKGRTNNFLIEYKELRILVDTSGRLRYRQLVNSLRKNLGSQKLDYLFLSHTHFDHSKNAFRIKNEFGCKIIADEREAAFLSAGSTPLPNGTMLMARIIVWLGRKLSHIDRYTGTSCDICVDDIYEIKTRTDPIRILRTPGHSAGSLSIILDNEIALVGDCMFGKFRNRVFPPFADDVPELLNSWEKLLKTGASVFLAGHGRAITRKELEQNLELMRKKHPRNS